MWRRVEPTINTKIGHRVVVSKTFIMPDDALHHFQTVSPEGSECIATIALTPDKKVIVARQFRPGPEKIMDELPGGYLEPGEDREAAARRELLEETGYEAGKMEHLGHSYRDAYHNSLFHYFLATNCTPHNSGQLLEPTEHVTVKLLTIDQLLENGRNGKMTDTEALFLAHDKLMNAKGEA